MDKATAHADVKFHSQMPFTNVDVCFRTREELTQFIGALQQLLATSDPKTIVYLQDSAAALESSEASDALSAEVCFHSPGFARDELDLRCLSAARSQLEALTENET